MRRVVLALGGTVAGLVMLLSFRSHMASTASAGVTAGSGGTGTSPGSSSSARSGSSAASGASAASAPVSAGSGTGTAVTGDAIATPYGPTQVQVTLNAGKIVKVTVLQHSDDGINSQQIDGNALPILNNETLTAQSAKIERRLRRELHQRGLHQVPAERAGQGQRLVRITQMSGIGPAGLPGSAGPGDAAAAAGVTGISVSNPDLPGPGATSPGGTQIGRPAGRLRHAEHVMGTVFSFDVPASAAPVLPEVLSWLHWVDDTFSTYSCGSDVSRFGRGELTLAECAPELAEVIAECAAIEERTDGYFTAWPGGRFDPSGLVKGWSIERASNMLSAAAETSVAGGWVV